MAKIVFLIRALDAGGAERQLVVTALGLADRGHDVTVLTFYTGGFYADELNNTKVNLISLKKNGRWDVFPFLLNLRRVIKNKSPDIIYSFLGSANILSVFIRNFVTPVRIIWGVRASNMDLDQYNWLMGWSYWLECRLARFADIIIANSYSGKEYAIAHGFPENKMIVIPNGIDTKRFRINKSVGEKLRNTWGVMEGECLVGVVGRIDPMKGIPIFLEAAALIKQHHPQARFVWVGASTGGNAYEHEMHRLSTKLELDDVMIWAGRRTDMVAVYNAFDIACCCSSYGEGFPNVLGEAMACGVPCIATDVGDSAKIIGGTGKIVPSKDSHNLAKELRCMVRQSEIETVDRISIRKRIYENYSVDNLLDHTEQVLCASF